MFNILLTLLISSALLVLVILYFIKFALAAKKTLLSEEIAWSAKTINISHKKKNIKEDNKDNKAKSSFLEDIANQSSAFLKDN